MSAVGFTDSYGPPLGGASRGFGYHPAPGAGLTEQAASWARVLEDRFCRQAGATQVEARELAARCSGVAPGTFENLRRGRLKMVTAFVHEQLRAALARELEAEIGALTHELHLVRQGAARRGLDEVEEIEAHLAKARELLNRRT